MINQKITITVDSYDLESWKKALIEKCIMDNPNQPIEYIAALIGIHKGTLQRMKQKIGLKLLKSTRKILAYNLENNY